MHSYLDRYHIPSHFTGLRIQAACGGYDKNLSYLLTQERTGHQWLIDPALPPESFSPPPSAALKGILITHGHGDHLACLDDYMRMSPGAMIYSASLSFPGRLYQHLSDGDIIALDDDMIRVLATPGHYPDSLSFYYQSTLFTGDTLFVGRTGRTTDPAADTTQLYHSVYFKLLTLPPDTLIFPGHDYGIKPWVTIEENITISPLLQASDENDFIHRMAAFESSRKP